jgi:hypothetical protein
MSPILGIWASQNYSRYSITGSYESIATATVGAGGQNTVEFTNIPQNYTHLQIRGLVRQLVANNVIGDAYIRFNGDTGSNYAVHVLEGYVNSGGTGTVSAGAATAGAPTSRSAFRLAGSGAATSMFSPVIIDILDYANTNKYKTQRSLSGTNQNTQESCINFQSELWLSTSAITSILIGNIQGGYGSTVGWAEYTHFALYGIKGA